MTEQKNMGPIDGEDAYGATVTSPAVAGRRGQVVPEGAARRGSTQSRIHDAADEERKAAMRAFFRTACGAGLDCKSGEAAERMRRELSYFLGRWVQSRRDVATGEWLELQTAAWCGRLAW